MRKSMFALPLAAALVFSACTKKTTESEAPQPQRSASAVSAELSSTHHWKYFSAGEGGSVELKNADAVSDIPVAVFKPWTEAVRVADFGLHHENAAFLINAGCIRSALYSQPRSSLWGTSFFLTLPQEIYIR